MVDQRHIAIGMDTAKRGRASLEIAGLDSFSLADFRTAFAADTATEDRGLVQAIIRMAIHKAHFVKDKAKNLDKAVNLVGIRKVVASYKMVLAGLALTEKHYCSRL
mmetsp:Transcript_47885/g.35098  ORF Transcript_47885/g.35098 Transcript_47885/m.35098 type:complete len:106 (-) Transcript_47885:3-320(-)